MRRLALAAAVAIGTSLCSLESRAHQTSVSYSELEVHGAQVSGSLRFSATDLATQIRLDANGDGLVSQAELDAVAPAVLHLVLGGFQLSQAGAPCPATPGEARADGGDGVVLSAVWTCPGPVEAMQVRVGFIDSFPLGHTHLSKIVLAPDEVSQRVAQSDSPSFEVQRTPGTLRAAGRFLLLGMEHIFTGYDHIAFLLALLLLGGSLRTLVKIITSFTVAHSVTLALAALGLVTPSPRLIEPAIALSIVYVGLENLWALRAHKTDAALGHRWRITFAFGLIHGFGFASVLRELQLPRASLAAGLVTFNLGVEAGQVCIVALLLPLLSFLRKQSWFGARGVRAASGAVSALGAYWLVVRLLGRG